MGQLRTWNYHTWEEPTLVSAWVDVVGPKWCLVVSWSLAGVKLLSPLVSCSLVLIFLEGLWGSVPFLSFFVLRVYATAADGTPTFVVAFCGSSPTKQRRNLWISNILSKSPFGSRKLATRPLQTLCNQKSKLVSQPERFQALTRRDWWF